MDVNLFFYSSSSESESECDINAIRRKIRVTSDPLGLPNNEFKKRFRVSKEAFNYILEELEFAGHLTTAVPAKIQLATTLLLLASGGFQNTVGNDFIIGISQSALSKIVSRVLDEMEMKLCPKFINFSTDSWEETKEFFMKKYKLPGVIGCVDGTHFGLQKPPNEHMFFNRKGFHSLNSMVICDHKYVILAINSKYGGAAHDSFVWKESDERIFLEEKYKTNLRNFWLLGDSGYPLEAWLITPYRSPQEGSRESQFNDTHAKARCIVERTIGILKARWKILCHDKRSRYTPQKVAKYSNVCSALHNLCIKFKVPNYEDVQQTNIDEAAVNFDTETDTQITKIGKQIRDNIKNSLFPN